jgi:hypothetical protein
VYLCSADNRTRLARPSGPATWAGGPSRRGKGGAQLRQRWWRPDRIPVALSDEVYPFWGGGKEELTGRMSSTVRCGRPEGNGGGGGGKEELTERMSLIARCGRPEANGGGGGGKEELTGRMSSTARCGRPEGNGGEGGVQGWWSMAQGAGRLYTATWCSGHGRNNQREGGVEEEERMLHGGGGRPL